MKSAQEPAQHDSPVLQALPQAPQFAAFVFVSTHLPEQLHERAFALAETIASQAPLGVQATLASAQQVRLGHVEGAIDALIPQARTLMASEDAKEGLHSFLERRDAVFQGK